jgi:hypothetical protein
METILSISIGISLSAAAGFRIFVPLFVMSIAAQAGYLSPAEGFEWIGTTPALIAFGVATIVEILAYYIPIIDNLLDTIATPAAVVAGVVLTASTVTGLSPFLTWTLAIIAGGGVAGIVQSVTGISRLASTTTTAGVGNSFVATAELGGATFLSAMALFFPFLGIALVILFIFWGIGRFKHRNADSHMK